MRLRYSDLDPEVGRKLRKTIRSKVNAFETFGIGWLGNGNILLLPFWPLLPAGWLMNIGSESGSEIQAHKKRVVGNWLTLTTWLSLFLASFIAGGMLDPPGYLFLLAFPISISGVFIQRTLTDTISASELELAMYELYRQYYPPGLKNPDTAEELYERFLLHVADLKVNGVQAKAVRATLVEFNRLLASDRQMEQQTVKLKQLLSDHPPERVGHELQAVTAKIAVTTDTRSRQSLESRLRMLQIQQDKIASWRQNLEIIQHQRDLCVETLRAYITMTASASPISGLEPNSYLKELSEGVERLNQENEALKAAMEEVDRLTIPSPAEREDQVQTVGRRGQS